MKYNYVEVNKSYFPTLCEGYPFSSKIETRMMTVNDVKLISMLDDNNANQIIKEVIRRCCRFTNMTIDDLYLADRNFLMFWLRSGSFISYNGYTFTYEHCPYCKYKAEIKLALQDLELDTCTEFYKVITLNNHEVICKLPKINDFQVNLKDKELERVLNYTNLIEIFGSVQTAITEILQFDAMTYIKLLNVVDSMKCGIKEELSLTCPHCHNTINEKVLFTNKEIAGTADIKEVLSNIIAISKYSNFQVSDDMLYAEVEIMGQIVSEMVEAENKAYEQSQGTQTLGH